MTVFRVEDKVQHNNGAIGKVINLDLNAGDGWELDVLWDAKLPGFIPTSYTPDGRSSTDADDYALTLIDRVITAEDLFSFTSKEAEELFNSIRNGDLATKEHCNGTAYLKEKYKALLDEVRILRGVK